MKHQISDTEDSWCTSVTKREVVPVSKEQQTEQQNFTDVLRGLFYSEERELTEDGREEQDKIEAHRGLFDSEQRDGREGQDKIEAHRIMMERPREKDSPREENKRGATSPKEVNNSRAIVTQGYYGSQLKTVKRTKTSMVRMAKQTLDEEQVIKKYLTPGTEDNNSAMLFLAGTLFSSNRYIFEFFNENGYFLPDSQKLVNALASDFADQSKRLRDALLKAERSASDAVRNLVVSCVNDFVATSNDLAKVLEEDYAAKSAAIDSTKTAIDSTKTAALNNIITTRNQISNSLYEFFQRIIEAEKSMVSATVSSATSVSKNIGDTVRFLTDAEQFSNFLFAGTDTKRVECGNGCNDVQTITNCSRTEPEVSPSFDAPITPTRTTTGIPGDDKTVAPDITDVLSTASSFLDFIHGQSLSAMFSEDERENRKGSVCDVNLDAIFERMDISIPEEEPEIGLDDNEFDDDPKENENVTTKTVSGTGRSSWIQSKRLSAREKRNRMITARIKAREEKKQKRARAKEESEKNSLRKKSLLGRRSKKGGKLEVLAEI
jgi:hypothetical protein